jgi:hypothetical protein
MDDVALAVPEHLDLDVPGSGHIGLQQHAVVAEGGGGLALAGDEGSGEVLRKLDFAHSLAAATGHRLDQDGVADLVRFALQALQRLVFAEIAGVTGT